MVLLLVLLGSTPAAADSLSLTAWAAGDSLNPTNLNLRHTQIQTVINGNLDTSNLRAAAAVKGSQLDLTDGTGRLVQSATLTTDQRMFQSSPTWNGSSITFEGWFLNVTDTASASESLLMDLQLGGTSMFKVGKGTVTRISGSGEVPFIVASGPSLTFTGTTQIQQQRFVQFDSPIITNTSAMTIDNAATVYIASGPRCQGNVTCTGGWALWVDNGGTRLDGSVFLNDTANAKATLGLTLNQGAADDEIIALKSSDVAHGITGTTETDTYARILKLAGTGGLHIAGFTPDTVGLQLRGAGTTDVTTKATTSNAYIELVATKKSGANEGATGADANLVAVRDGSTTRFIFDTEGSAHADVEWTTYDTHNDLMLLASLERELTPVESMRSVVEADLGGSLGYSREELQRAKIVNFYDDGPRAMVNFTRLSMLQSGAIRQVHRIVKDQDVKLGWALSRLAHLERLLGQRPQSELAAQGR